MGDATFLALCFRSIRNNGHDAPPPATVGVVLGVSRSGLLDLEEVVTTKLCLGISSLIPGYGRVSQTFLHSAVH